MPPKGSGKKAAASSAAGTKRPASEDFEDNAGEGSSKTAPQETRAQKDARQLKEKTDKYYTAARERDTAPGKSMRHGRPVSTWSYPSLTYLD